MGLDVGPTSPAMLTIYDDRIRFSTSAHLHPSRAAIRRRQVSKPAVALGYSIRVDEKNLVTFWRIAAADKVPHII